MSNTKLIENGTIKVYSRGDVPVDITDGGLTPIITIDGVNTEEKTYKASDLDEGKYTYAASAPNKGTKVGEFVLPDPNATEGETTKSIGPILLTAGIEPVKLILTDKDGENITEHIRALVAGIDAAHQSGTPGTWQVADPFFVPTNMNTKIHIIPDNTARAGATKPLLQNLKVWKPVSVNHKEHSIQIFPPISIVVNVWGKRKSLPNDPVNLNHLSNTKVEIALLDSNGNLPEGESFKQLLSSPGQGFLLNDACNGTYRVRVVHEGVYNPAAKTFIAEWSEQSSSIMIDVYLDSVEDIVPPTLDRTYKVEIIPTFNNNLVTDAVIVVVNLNTAETIGPKWVEDNTPPTFNLEPGQYQVTLSSPTRGLAIHEFAVEDRARTITVAMGHQV